MFVVVYASGRYSSSSGFFFGGVWVVRQSACFVLCAECWLQVQKSEAESTVVDTGCLCAQPVRHVQIKPVGKKNQRDKNKNKISSPPGASSDIS